MKKLLLVSLLLVSNVYANPHHNRGHGHWQKRGPEWVWVIPAVVGGVVVYQATRPRVHPLADPSMTVCSPWTEIHNPDGTITRTRTCTQ